MKRLGKWTAVTFLVLLVNTDYISSVASPTIFYMTNVLLHLGLGLGVAAALALLLAKNPALRKGAATASGIFILVLVTGIYLASSGNTLPNRWALWAHIIVGGLSVVALVPNARRQAQMLGGGWLRFRNGLQAGLALMLILPAGAYIYARAFPNPKDRIENPMIVPATMEGEGAGPQSPFFPSSANTNTKDIIPSNFFMDSESCAECHPDAVEQWRSSAHHFASFNNQFYRKSIEYMQDVVGTEPSKWCAGCHDHAVFFNGRFERPIKEQIDTPEAHAGLACTSCHAIVSIDSSMGNGGFTIEYPPLHELATSKNKYLRALHSFLTYLDPEPHRRTFIKPFMRENAAEFCSACHKVHLDIPVNDYRWFRGFNDYDGWQASGVSGQGARSFYYPEKSSNCVDCHMPLVPSNNTASRDGKVHSHRFAAANTALAYVNKDYQQLALTEEFLKANKVTVDIFAASPVKEQDGALEMVRRGGEGMSATTSFGVGEEAEQSGQVFIREVGELAAPIDKAGVKFRPGSEVRVDVVVRTRGVGHLFPGGTIDAFDVWLELQGKDAAGNVIFWSGMVEDDGKGPVEPGAHFYRAVQLDGEGNKINKRNAWQTRSVLYVRQIPPGSADVAHYRIKIPQNATGPITLTAKLNYRKFSHYFTQFAYAGQPKEGQDPSLVGAAHNSLEYSFDPANIPENVSGQIKDAIPDLPIVIMAEAQTKLELGDSGSEPEWKPVIAKEDRERWNDWGIGLLLQGDLKVAEYAFRRVTEAEPEYADGWLNVARTLIQEGETDAAKPFVAKAMEINGNLGRVHFFKAMIEKADGDYDAALESLQKTESMFPKDRVVLNQIARILFLKRQFKEALKYLDRVRQIDPEDLQMHYTAMLCYRGVGEKEKAAVEEKLFRRFKADEAAQTITARARMLSPEDNNERQAVHDHESVAADVLREIKPVISEGKQPKREKQDDGAKLTARTQ